jgi:L-rhamnose isomerase
MVKYPVFDDQSIEQGYLRAKEAYASVGVDTEGAVERALSIPISVHCWQADDVAGFENLGDVAYGGGIMATGNFPGRARNADEVRMDIEKVFALLPGTHRFNLHASYAEVVGAGVDRDALTAEHFSRWMDWAREQAINLDFNTTFFAHPKADDGYTLAHRDDAIRDFWVRHGIAARRIAEAMARSQGTPCVINHWIPDGEKDATADRWQPRERLVESLDRIFDTKHGVDTEVCLDAVESKLFGLASEDYVVGSAEFYSSYALSRGLIYCLDMGHFHPTETIHDKISALLAFHKKLLIHTSRPMRWDSDHVVLFDEPVKQVFLELQRGNAFDRVDLALDFFDASINRIAAYVVGTRANRKALLFALLDPTGTLQALEAHGQRAQKLALMEEMKTMPFGDVWNFLCLRGGVPAGGAWIPEVEKYAETVLAARG